MGLDQLLSLLRGDNQLERLSQEVARRCESRIWDRTGARAVELPNAEARGYIRARSGLLLAEESKLLLQQEPGVSSIKPERLIEAAGEAAVQHAMRRVQQVRVAQRELRHVARAA